MAVWVYLLDLVDDETKIAEYESLHQRVWPEILDHLRTIGVQSCRIYRAGNRLVMLVESDAPTPTDGGGTPQPERVRQWEALMDQYQVRLPVARAGEKWVLAGQFFDWNTGR